MGMIDTVTVKGCAILPPGQYQTKDLLEHPGRDFVLTRCGTLWSLTYDYRGVKVYDWAHVTPARFDGCVRAEFSGMVNLLLERAPEWTEYDCLFHNGRLIGARRL